VRTLAHDIGAKLGTGAHLSALRRTAVGAFRVEDALPLDEVLRRGDEGSLNRSLIKPSAVLGHLPMLQISDADLQRVANGRELPLVDDEFNIEAIVPAMIRICDKSGELVAVGEVAEQRRSIKPRVVLMGSNKAE